MKKFAIITSLAANIRHLPGNAKKMGMMLKDYKKGAYKGLPWRVVLGTAVALIYFFSPIDFMPDFFPGIGYVDDVGVVLFTMKMFKSQLEEYDRWKSKQKG